MSNKLPTPEIRFASIIVGDAIGYGVVLSNPNDYEQYGFSNVYLNGDGGSNTLDFYSGIDEIYHPMFGDAIGDTEMLLSPLGDNSLPFSYSYTVTCEGYEDSDTVSGTFTGES